MGGRRGERGGFGRRGCWSGWSAAQVPGPALLTLSRPRRRLLGGRGEVWLTAPGPDSHGEWCRNAGPGCHATRRLAELAPTWQTNGGVKSIGHPIWNLLGEWDKLGGSVIGYWILYALLFAVGAGFIHLCRMREPEQRKAQVARGVGIGLLGLLAIGLFLSIGLYRSSRREAIRDQTEAAPAGWCPTCNAPLVVSPAL